MSCFWRRICTIAFVEPVETPMFASISPRSLVPVPGWLISGFQLEVLPQQRTSPVSTALLAFRIQLELFLFFILWWSCLLLFAKPRLLSHKRLSNLAGEAAFLDRWSEHFVSGYLSLFLTPRPVFPGISSVQKTLWFACHRNIQSPELLRKLYLFALMLNCSLEKHFARQFYESPEDSSFQLKCWA